MATTTRALPLLLLLVPGCFDSHGMHGPGTDAGVPFLDGDLHPDAAPTPCGETTCGAGEVCCSATCSVCGPAGEVCPDIDCLPSCLAQDAHGVGDCDAVLGWAWNGVECTGVYGCECVGSDCGDVSSSPENCESLHAHCDAGCGGRGGRTCGPDEWCDYPDDSCGAWDSTGVCRPRPDDCPEPGGVPVCGCDGVEYWDACPAHLSGVDQRSFGPCTGSGGFRHVRAERTCAPWDGPAWRFTFTESPASCDATSGQTLVIEVWTELEGVSPDTYTLGSGFGSGIEGSAMLCFGPGTPCQMLDGSITVNAFFTGEVGRLDYALTTVDGTAYAETGIELTSWCSTTFPGCG